MNDEKYLDPKTNPAIATDDDSKKDPEDLGGLEDGLPFEMRRKIDSKDLAKRIKSVFPKKTEIFIEDGISLGVQDSGDVEIIKPSKDKKGWDRSPLKDGTSKDLESIKKVVDDNEK